jgi:hypothetical protein
MGFYFPSIFGYIPPPRISPLLCLDTPARGVQTYSPLQKRNGGVAIMATSTMVDIPGF